MTGRRTLRIAPGLVLPLDAVTETFALLATRGAGKTYTSKVLIEEMLSAGLHVVVLDPMPAWWGLRSSADGKGAGFSIAIFGGEHSDLPLEPEAGRFIADLVVNERLSCILDVSEFSKTKRKQFVADFAERLYQKNREAMHLVLEEADLFAPQKPRAGEERMLGAIEDIVRRGRGRGIGTTLITQRSAVINKDVLELTANLIALRTTGPRDRAAIRGWLDSHGTPDEIRTIMDTLPGLPTGEGWFYSPHFMGTLQRIKVRRAETFDSSATPKPGQAKRRPKTVADVDLDAVKQAMADTIERAQFEDPSALQKKVRQLQGEVADWRKAWEEMKDQAAANAEAARVETVDVPVFEAAYADMLTEYIEKLRDQAAILRVDVAEKIDLAARSMLQSIEKTREMLSSGPVPPSNLERLAAKRKAPEPLSVRDAMGGIAAAAKEAKPARWTPEADQQVVTGPEQKILNALAWWLAVDNQAPSRLQVAMVAGYHPRTKSFTNALGRLRSAELIDYPEAGYIYATSSGLDLAQHVSRPGTEQDLQAMIYSQVKPGQARILQVLVEQHPQAIPREKLAEVLDYHPRTKAFTNNLGALRTLGLVEYPQSGYVRATAAMFLRRAA